MYIENGALLTVNNIVFSSITVNPLTNMAGLTSANVTYNNHNIAINWTSLTFNSDTQVILDIKTSAVPIPSAILLFGSGLIGLVGMRKYQLN
ncbi:MAG: PEP-CTERM sorting domain-containing protein [Methylobacter sp.]|nr:PEP-CTERM sorting domain-containing protein [Methylobacter sp.]